MSDTQVDNLLSELGRYRVVRQLGRGGMAEVYLATLEGPGGFSRDVVLKRIRSELIHKPRMHDMFLREARLAARLNHPNVVAVHEMIEEQGEYFLVMEYLQGLSLRSAARRAWAHRLPLPVEGCIAACADAALGLAHAHELADENGAPTPLIHRDISPDNLLVTRDGLTKVLDFGIAKTADSEDLTATDEIKGKLPFMSPEQLRGERLDGRADLWSLGVSLYWLLTGRRPFKSQNDAQRIHSILHQAPTPIRESNTAVPLDVEEIIMATLEKEPKNRPEDGRQLHDALARALGGVSGATVAADMVRELEQLEPLEEGQDGGFLPTRAAAPIAERMAFVPEDTLRVAVDGRAPIDAGADVRGSATATASPSPADLGRGLLVETPHSHTTRAMVEPTVGDRVSARGGRDDNDRVPSGSVTQNVSATDGVRAGSWVGSKTEPLAEARTVTTPVSRAKARLPPAAWVIALAFFAGLFAAALATRGGDAPPGDEQAARAVTPQLSAPADSSPLARAAAPVVPDSSAPTATPPAAQHPAPSLPTLADVTPDQQADEAVIAPDATPPRRTGARAARSRARSVRATKSAASSVVLRAPKRVMWRGVGGARLGSGSLEVSLTAPASEFVAVDKVTGGRSRVPVVDGRADYNTLPRGTLDIRVLPWGKVELGKEDLGTTPVPPQSLPVGEYRVAVEYKGQRREVSARVKAGKSQLVTVDFAAP